MYQCSEGEVRESCSKKTNSNYEEGTCWVIREILINGFITYEQSFLVDSD